MSLRDPVTAKERRRADRRIGTIAGHSFFPALLSSEAVVVDLGMNRGDFSLAIIERFGCRVIGVEPDDRVSIRSEAPPELSVESAAVGGKDGSIRLFRAPGLDATVHAELVPPGAEWRDVPVLSLKTIAERHDLDRIDLLKVDIEGAEIETLLGAPSEILERAVQISVEFHDWMNADLLPGTMDVDRRLRSLGFERLKFSRNSSDILYLNSSLASIGVLGRMWALLRYHYARGVRRWLARKVPQ